MKHNIVIRPEKHRDFKDIVSLELRRSSLKGKGGFVVYDMYFNA